MDGAVGSPEVDLELHAALTTTSAHKASIATLPAARAKPSPAVTATFPPGRKLQDKSHIMTLYLTHSLAATRRSYFLPLLLVIEDHLTITSLRHPTCH
jgi:hypothetical protein